MVRRIQQSSPQSPNRLRIPPLVVSGSGGRLSDSEFSGSQSYYLFFGDSERHLSMETLLNSIGPRPQVHSSGARVTNQVLRNAFVSTRDQS